MYLWPVHLSHCLWEAWQLCCTKAQCSSMFIKDYLSLSSLDIKAQFGLRGGKCRLPWLQLGRCWSRERRPQLFSGCGPSTEGVSGRGEGGAEALPPHQWRDAPYQAERTRRLLLSSPSSATASLCLMRCLPGASACRATNHLNTLQKSSSSLLMRAV